MSDEQESFTIGRYIFKTREEYDDALKDSALIHVIRRESDTTDPEVAARLYKDLKGKKDIFHSKIGKIFLHELATTVKDAELTAVTEKNGLMKYNIYTDTSGIDDVKDGISPKLTKAIIPKSEPEKERRSLLLILTAAVSILFLLFCVVRLVIYSISSFYSTKDFSQLRKMVGESSVTIAVDEETGRPKAVNSQAVPLTDEKQILEKYRDLYDMNNDLVGWLLVEGTNIDYPVMQTVFNEEFYLHTGYDKTESDEGIPFMDNRCVISPPSTNLHIYGHNMKNGHMFADLLKYKDESYYTEHPIIRFDTLYEEGLYEITAVFRTQIAYVDEDIFRYYGFVDADSKKEFNDYIIEIKHLSIYDTGIMPTYGDNLLTLSTCEYTNDDGRFVVIARKL